VGLFIEIEKNKRVELPEQGEIPREGAHNCFLTGKINYMACTN
jgi:hypothetical protein